MSEAPFLPQEVIRKKRDKVPLSQSDIDQFVSGITDGSVTHAQISAFAMAVFFNGMSAEEGAALTLAMRDSGDVMDHSGALIKVRDIQGNPFHRKSLMGHCGAYFVNGIAIPGSDNHISAEFCNSHGAAKTDTA